MTLTSLTRYEEHMRGAFIVQLGPETKPAEGRFEGWVQEVDLCREQRFRSSEELLKFLGERFEVARAVAEKTRAGNRRGPAPLRRKRPGTEKT
jgi:hypothetical protein